MEHCDFVPLRNMLIRTHLQDLKEVTNNVHYENYRCRKLAGVAGGTVEKIPNKVRKNSDIASSLNDIHFILNQSIINSRYLLHCSAPYIIESFGSN